MSARSHGDATASCSITATAAASAPEHDADGDEVVTEVLFYHLERQPLEHVLPTLLEKSLERGWRAIVHAGTQERLEALDVALWTYRDESFLPHGMANEGPPERQPVFLTTSDENPNAAKIRFLVEGAEIANLGDYDRVVYLFDGRIEEAVVAARQSWKAAKDGNHDVTYWQQAASGKWERRA